MNTVRVCPSCGKPLSADAPQGVCPECLLKAGMGTASGSEPSAEAGSAPPAPGEIAKLFPQLEILALLGKGGMGAVYKARQPGLDRLVALKVLPPRSGSDAGFAERFMREARTLARLNHPNIVAVYDFGRVEAPNIAVPMGEQTKPAATGPVVLHYFIMEYVDGLNLRQVQQADKLAPRQALEIIPQICEALQFAHDEGIVHRDIKPENVLLDKRGRVKIADFGLAKLLGQEPQDLRLTGVKDVMGTPHYMAPEQLEHPQEVDHRADIYSLGVVFYELLTGELPLGKFAPPSKKVQVDVRLDEVVLHALEKEPGRRYQHASQVKTDVETITHSSGGATAGPVGATDAYGDVEEARQQVKGPAIALLVAGIVGALFTPAFALVGLYLLLRDASESGSAMPVLPAALMITIGFAFLAASVVMIVAARRMKRLESYGLALTGSLVAAFGSPIGLPIAVWAIVVLTQRQVKKAFEHKASADARVAKSSHQLVRWALAGAAMIVLMAVLSAALGLLARASARHRLALQTPAGVEAPPSFPADVLRRYKAIALDLRNLKLRRLELGRQYTDAHPMLVQVQHQITTLEKEKADLEDLFPALLNPALTASEAALLRIFTTADRPISRDLTLTDDGALAANCTSNQTFQLYEVANPGVDQCRLIYFAKIKTENLVGRAYLEMWVVFNGGGQAFSRGLDNTASGSNDWATYQTPFFLKAGERPDAIRLNLVVEGKGQIWIKDIQLEDVPWNGK
ncbi:membrane hypothetical protein [Verrucomicrobia bacterium]|nr:membrane hypothetical protein [Verrucomicrobiota bacterium]